MTYDGEYVVGDSYDRNDEIRQAADTVAATAAQFLAAWKEGDPHTQLNWVGNMLATALDEFHTATHHNGSG